jgi:hypothetical protein
MIRWIFKKVVELVVIVGDGIAHGEGEGVGQGPAGVFMIRLRKWR